ncbi:hypothetical protein IKE67_00520 [bacterium]|nr:hypothetical protein [bacterium]
MTKFKNYFNAISGDERIFSREDIANMTNTEYKNNEKAINYQLTNIGVPTNKELMNSENVVYVKAYKKDDGTNVKAHYRSKPDNKLTNNLSYIANVPQENTAEKSNSEIRTKLMRINEEKNKDNPDAKELMRISIVGAKNISKNDKYTVIPSSKTKSINNALRINNSLSLKINNKWSGVRFAEDSRLSKNLSNSPQLQKQVRNYCQKHKNIDNNAQIGIELTEDKNLHYSIGHGTILNPSIDKNGNFNGLLFDKYDFDLMIKELFSKNYKTAVINDFAYGLQEVEAIENYYLLIPIKFKL